MRRIDTSISSLFYNNRTQSARLKKGIRFEASPKRLIAFNIESEETHAIYLVEEENERQFLTEYMHSLKDSGETVNPDEEEPWRQCFDGRKSVSVFLNNTTQSIRIPASFTFPEDEKNVDVIRYALENDGQVLVLIHNK